MWVASAESRIEEVLKVLREAVLLQNKIQKEGDPVLIDQVFHDK